MRLPTWLRFRRGNGDKAQDELARSYDRLRQTEALWPDIYRARYKLERWIDQALGGDA